MTEKRSRRDAIPRLPVQGQDDTQDQLLGIVTALAAQLAVTRERLDTVERLAQASGLFGPAQVDAFVPDEQAGAHRDGLRHALIARIFRPVQDGAARTARRLKGDDA